MEQLFVLGGYMELAVSVGDEKDTRKVNSQFLFVSCRSVYNCVLGRPFATMLNVVASPMHLKLKYQNLQGEMATIKADIDGKKRIYQALQKDQGEGVAMDINVASFPRTKTTSAHPLITIPFKN